jgi:hypothetical protein
MLKLIGVKNVHWIVSHSLTTMKIILPKSWYHNLLQWLVKTSLVSFWDKMIIMKDIKIEQFMGFLQHFLHIVTKK